MSDEDATAARAVSEMFARERRRGGRTGTYDVQVTDENGDAIAYFRGTSYRVTRDA